MQSHLRSISFLFSLTIALLTGCNFQPVENAVLTVETESQRPETESQQVETDITATPKESPTPDESESVTTTQAHGSFYTVSTYDKTIDPAEDLAKTIQRATEENKRIILQVGGDWCGWCTRISNYMSTNDTVRSHLEDNFLVMKVTYPGDHAKAFLANYPKCEAYPHFFVLEPNGEFLHSQGTGELEKGKGYDDAVFIEFLDKWTR